jgi:hypothetical protein
MADRETIIESAAGGTAAVVAGLLIVALVIVGAFFFVGVNSPDGSKTISLDVPKVTVSVAPNRQ